MRPRGQRGFTLIELLLVISIISLFVAILLAVLNDARRKARDSARIQQMAELQKGLELYYADHGHYPSGRGYSAWDTKPTAIPYWCFSGNGGCGDSMHPILDLVNGGYVKPPPDDPLNYEGWNWLAYDSRNTRGSYSYLYCSNYAFPAGCPTDNQHYRLGVNLESRPQGSDLYGNYQLGN